jgi:hypothetical protein
MRLSELFENDHRSITEKVEMHPYRDYVGNEFDLKLIWNPTARQAKNLVDQSRETMMRVLLVGDKAVIWDAHYVEHADVEKLLGLPRGPREIKLFLYMDFERYMISAKSLEHPFVKKMRAGGFSCPSGGFG